MESRDEDIHMSIYMSPSDIYGMEITEVNPKNSVPESLTADMIINCENVDWTEYVNFYNDVSPDSPIRKLITEGEILFAEALAKAQTDEERHFNQTTMILKKL